MTRFRCVTPDELAASVGLGEIGLVLALEVSRLARSSADWHRLLDLCALTGTLIADQDGVYSPGDFNDRLLLGLKGTMSEAELHLIRARLGGGLRNKAERGELALSLPVGLDRDEQGRVVLSPDEQVRATIARVAEIHREGRRSRRPRGLELCRANPPVRFVPFVDLMGASLGRLWVAAGASGAACRHEAALPFAVHGAHMSVLTSDEIEAREASHLVSQVGPDEFLVENADGRITSHFEFCAASIAYWKSLGMSDKDAVAAHAAQYELEGVEGMVEEFAVAHGWSGEKVLRERFNCLDARRHFNAILRRAGVLGPVLPPIRLRPQRSRARRPGRAVARRRARARAPTGEPSRPRRSRGPRRPAVRS